LTAFGVGPTTIGLHGHATNEGLPHSKRTGSPGPVSASLTNIRQRDLHFPEVPLGQKIEAVGNRSIRRSLVGRRAVVGNMQQRIADLAIFVLGCCELHSQNQAQL
jgi:hypothetical protein